MENLISGDYCAGPAHPGSAARVFIQPQNVIIINSLDFIPLKNSYSSVQCHSPIEAKISSMSSWLSATSDLTFFFCLRPDGAGADGCFVSCCLFFHFFLAFKNLNRLLWVWKRVTRCEFPFFLAAKEPQVLIADPRSDRTWQTSRFKACNFLRTLQMGRKDGDVQFV